MLIVMNVLVIATAAVLGWLSGEVAGGVVEERLVSEVAKNTAGFVRDRHLPFSDALMNSLSEMFSMDFATVRVADGEILGSSFPGDLAGELRRQIGEIGTRGTITLNDERYLVDSYEIIRKNERTGLKEQLQVCAIASHQQFQDARDKTLGRIAGLALPAVIVATLLAVGLSFTISRPIRKLADEMDRLADEEAAGNSAVSHSAVRKYGSRGPTEVARLATSFQRLLERLDGAQSQLARSERLAALGKVAAGVAHELRNPLSGIKMNVRVLKDELSGGDVDESGVNLILREIDRMDLYLQELMGLSATDRPEDSGLGEREDLAEVHLPELIDSALSLMSGRCKHAGVEVLREIDASAPPVRANADQLRQVLVNLIVNALEAMPGGGKMTLCLEAAAGETVRLWVRDTGEGVRIDAGSDIFEPFISTKGNSAGLGLYISKQIVAAHGGEIGYRSSDAGAAFWFELPATGAGNHPE